HTLETKAGRAELVLQLHNYLRIDEQSSVEMRSDELADVRLAIRGAAILEIGALDKVRLAAACGQASVSILKPGIYRLNCPDSLFVYRGRANVGKSKVEAGQTLSLEPGAKARKFDVGSLDAFDRWSVVRGRQIALVEQPTPGILPEIPVDLDDARI